MEQKIEKITPEVTEEINQEFSNISLIIDDKYLKDIEVEAPELKIKEDEEGTEEKEYPEVSDTKEIESEKSKLFPQILLTKSTTQPESAEVEIDEKENEEGKAVNGFKYEDNKSKVDGVVAKLLAKKKVEIPPAREVYDKELERYIKSKVDKTKTEPIDTVLNDEEEDLREDEIITSPSSTIGQSILASLVAFPDFSSNTFTAIIVPKYYQDAPGELDIGNIAEAEPDDLNEVKAARLLKDSFGVRLEGIDIPQPKKEAFETKFLNTSIKRVKPGTTLTRNVSLNIRLDTDLYICEFFERASGFSRWRKEGDRSAVELFPALFSMNLHNQDRINTDHAAKGTFDLYVYHQIKRDRAQPIDIKHNYILYILRDMKPLGRSGNLDFKSEGANPLQASFKFTYRRCEQFYYEA